MYILLFACACDKRAVVTATHYILHMFCLFCTCVACSHYMLQEVGFNAETDISTSELKKTVGVDDQGKPISVLAGCKQMLVRLYLHPHDARALHLSFSVNIARW